MTGGGPGIMEAANRGAFENGGACLSAAIFDCRLSRKANPYVQNIHYVRIFFSSERSCW